MPQFVLPPDHGLPEAVVQELDLLAGTKYSLSALTTGLCLRWALTTEEGIEHPLAEAVEDWIAASPPVVLDELESLVCTGAAQLATHMEYLQGEDLNLQDLEHLALHRDALTSECALLMHCGRGKHAREVERTVDAIFQKIADRFQGEAQPYTSAFLEALARRNMGWWTVAPGTLAPPLDPDVVLVGEILDE
jgi:hypothetical protein